jgi:phosphoglycerate dehydrogenase-like enzyme
LEIGGIALAELLQVGITCDFATEGRGLLDGVLADAFESVPGLSYQYMPASGPIADPDCAGLYDAIIALRVQFTAASLQGVERLAVISRWGVGCDMIDIAACTDNDVAVCITPDAVRRPVAEGVVCLMLALCKHLLVKDRLARTGRWDEKTKYVGRCLVGRAVGSVGVGNIGAEVLRLLKVFSPGRLLVYDPYVSTEQLQGLAVEQVDLDTLLRESDLVTINCPLTPETHHLIGERELALMKPTACLVNTSRGAVIDQVALAKALRAGWIAGAALDVFEEEPIASGDPLIAMDNVILSPHAIAWTEELVRDNGIGACENVLSVLRGEPPGSIVNREVLEHARFQAKLEELGRRWQALASRPRLSAQTSHCQREKR